MRATISFDIDVDQVEGAMGHLVSREAHNFRAAADILEDYVAPRDHLLDEVTEALRLISEATSQLEQYRSMLLNFERAKYETPAPTPSIPVENLGEVRESLNKMKRFDEFVDRIPSEEAPDDPEEG